MAGEEGFNFFANPNTYSTGTITQSGTTITGSGTVFPSGVVGGTVVWSDNTTDIITARTDTSHLTVTTSQTKSSQNFTIRYGGLNVAQQKVSFSGTVNGIPVFNNAQGTFNPAVTVVTSGPQALAAGGRYFANSGSQISFTCPASPSQGDRYEIYGQNAAGWKVTYGTGQSITLVTAAGSSNSTTTTGSLNFAHQYDGVILIAISTTQFLAYALGPSALTVT